MPADLLDDNSHLLSVQMDALIFSVYSLFTVVFIMTFSHMYIHILCVLFIFVPMTYSQISSFSGGTKNRVISSTFYIKTCIYTYS